MANLYSKPSISGYNANPPSDDGSETSNNEVTWSKHKAKLADPIKTLLDTVNDRIETAIDTLEYSLLAGETGVTNYEYPWWNVKRYGAKGDNVTDDTVAIQNAIDSVPANGAIVYLPAGTYKTTSGIALNDNNVILRGDGLGSQINCVAASNYAVEIGDGNPTSVSKQTVEKLYINCGGAGSSGILVRSGSNVGTVIRNIRLNNCATGIDWGETTSPGAFDGLMDHIDIDVYSGQTGIAIVENASAVTIRSCYIRGFNGFADTTSKGVSIQGGSSSITIRDCNIEGLATNIEVLGTNGDCYGIVIDGNYFETYGAAGLDIDLSSGVKSASIVNNYAVDSQGGVGGNAAANSVRIQNGATNIYFAGNQFLNQTSNSILNNSVSSTAGIYLVGNHADSGGNLISSVTGVMLNITAGNNQDWIFHNENKGLIIGASAGSGIVKTTIQESVDRSAAHALLDTDGSTGAYAGLAKDTDAMLTGVANLDYVINVINNKNIVMGVNDTKVVTIGAYGLAYSGTPQTLTGPGAINLTTPVTYVVTTGIDALTLADGTQGQEKYIVMTTDGGDGTLTPTNLAIYTTITFNDVGDSIFLKFLSGQWHVIGGTATLA